MALMDQSIIRTLQRSRDYDPLGFADDFHRTGWLPDQCLEILPPEVWEMIFEMANLMKLRLVCRRWRSIIDGMNTGPRLQFWRTRVALKSRAMALEPVITHQSNLLRTMMLYEDQVASGKWTRFFTDQQRNEKEAALSASVARILAIVGQYEGARAALMRRHDVVQGWLQKLSSEFVKAERDGAAGSPHPLGANAAGSFESSVHQGESNRSER